MTIFSGIVVYILAWWMMLFCVLPLNIENITRPTDGAMPGAPVNPGLRKKFILTTLLAGAVWLVIYLIVKSNLISFYAIAQQWAM